MVVRAEGRRGRLGPSPAEQAAARRDLRAETKSDETKVDTPAATTPAANDTEPAAGPTRDSAEVALASSRWAGSYHAHLLQQSFDAPAADEPSLDEPEASEADRQLEDATRLRDRADAVLADVPPDVSRLAFEVEKENGGADYLSDSWDAALRANLGPGDSDALESALQRNEAQLDLLADITFGNTRPITPDYIPDNLGAEHLYEPLIASLAADNPGATFELVAAEESARRGQMTNDAPMIAMTVADGDEQRTQFYSVNANAVMLNNGAMGLEEAVYESGELDTWYEAFQARPEFEALDTGDPSDTLYRLQQHPQVAFDVIGDLPPDVQANIMDAYGDVKGRETFGGILQEVPPPEAVLVAVNADHLAVGGDVPDVIRSSVDIGGVRDNNKDRAVLEANRETLYDPIFAQYNLRGEQAPISGADLTNEVGTALGLTPDRFPETAAEQQAFDNGEFVFFSDEAQAIIDPVVEQIRETGGTPVAVQTIPLMVESDATGRPPARPIPLFRIEDQNGNTRFIDDTGRRYSSVDDWRDNNRLPPGTISYPEDLELRAADPNRPAEVDFVTEPTHAVRDTAGEWALAVLDGAAIVGGVALGVTAIAVTGGAASPAVAAALTWGGATLAGYSTVRAGFGLHDLATHGESLNPLESGEARSLWLDGAAGAFGFAAFGSTAAARSLASAGNAGLAQGVLRTTAGLHTAAIGADFATIGNMAHMLSTNWDELSGSERAGLVAQIGFWGGLSAAGAHTNRYAAADVQARLGDTADTIFDATGYPRALAPAAAETTLGRSPLVGNFDNLYGASVEEILARIPADATRRELSPKPGYVEQGAEYKFQLDGQTYRVRIHGIDASRPPTDNAGAGWIVRVQRGSRYADGEGNFHPPGIHNPNSPHFSEALSGDTHIPIAGNPIIED